MWMLALVALAAAAQTALPPGVVAVINQAKSGARVAMCADTGEPTVQQGPKKIRATGVWVGDGTTFWRVEAGLGACDPAWSPDGRILAVTAAEGLWLFPASSPDGELRVESRLPMGGSTEFNYRAFSSPKWSPDGMLVGLLVTNGGTSWVEVFDINSGRLVYTSPPGTESFTWNRARGIKIGDSEIQLPLR